LTGPLQALQLSFNRLANDFHILDQVSGSLPPFFHIKAYAEVLRDRLRDEALLEGYKKLRQKYQRMPAVFKVPPQHGMQTDPSHLFAPAPDEVIDPMCDSFFTSTTLDEALGKLRATLTEDESLFVREVFDAFGPTLDALYKTNAWGLAGNLDRLNRALGGGEDEADDDDEESEGGGEPLSVERHLVAMRAFYGVEERPFRSVLLLWCPKGVGCSGNAYGDHLLLRTSGNSFPREDIVHMLVSVLAHEATHHISGCMSQVKKERLSVAFRDVAGVVLEGHPLLWLEEPLVMATQMALVHESGAALFARQKKWFNHPSAHRFFEIVRQALAAERPLDEELIRSCARTLGRK